MHAVTLTVTDNDGLATMTTTLVTLTARELRVDFTAEPKSARPNVLIQFASDMASPDASVVAWQWDFGDGQTSRSNSPTHAYASPGTYRATLTARDNLFRTNATTREIVIMPPPELAAPQLPTITPPSRSATPPPPASPAPAGESSAKTVPSLGAAVSLGALGLLALARRRG